MAPGLRQLAPALAGALLALAPAAVAAPRTGSATDPDEGLGTNRDIAQVRSSYEPTSGRFDLAVRFHQPLASTPRGTVEVYFREDDSGACSARSSDVRFRFEPDPAADGESGAQVVAGPLGSPALAEKRTSADRFEITSFFTDSRLASFDMRCTFAQTTGAFTGDPALVPPTFDRLEPPLYFTGFEPPDLAPPKLAVTAARTQRLGRTGTIRLTASSNEKGQLEALASVRVARRTLLFRSVSADVTVPGSAHTLKPRLSRSSLAKVKKALAGGAKLTARVEVSADDLAGNSASLVRKIRLKP